MTDLLMKKLPAGASSPTRTAKSLIFALLCVCIISGTSGCAGQEKVTLYVSAAASLTDPLSEINTLYMEQNSSLEILNNFAASGDLQAQIENGAPTDVFISAATRNMDALEEKALIIPETQRDILSNRLVLIAPMDSELALTDFADLLTSEIKLIAMGDPEFVPAGAYGLQTLELLNISYETLKPKLILANNVRQVLSYVESGSVDAGIVYLSDAATSDLIKVIATAPDEINNSIVFPVAIIASSKQVESAQKYVDYLAGTEAAEIFFKHGFIVIGQ